MNIENQKFEDWRNEQINSLVRMGYPDAAKAFRDLGTIHWAGWQAAWKASRESLEIELPDSYMDGLCESLEADHVRKAIEAAGLKVRA